MSQNSPKVSIILPTYNGAAYIQQAIESCLNQTYTDFELIIIDDASTDCTVEIVRSIQDARIRLILLEKNQGHIAALNYGFSLSKGDFLTWTSDDNYYAPHAIASMLNVLLQEKSIDFVYTRYHIINEQGEIARQGKTEDPSYLDIDNCIGGCFLYSRKVYESLGNFNQEAFLAEDYEYWLRVRAKFKMKKLDDVLYYYRDHSKSLTGVHKEEAVQRQVQRIRKQHVSFWKRMNVRIINQFKSFIRR